MYLTIPYLEGNLLLYLSLLEPGGQCASNRCYVLLCRHSHQPQEGLCSFPDLPLSSMSDVSLYLWGSNMWPLLEIIQDQTRLHRHCKTKFWCLLFICLPKIIILGGNIFILKYSIYSSRSSIGKLHFTICAEDLIHSS